MNVPTREPARGGPQRQPPSLAARTGARGGGGGAATQGPASRLGAGGARAAASMLPPSPSEEKPPAGGVTAGGVTAGGVTAGGVTEGRGSLDGIETLSLDSIPKTPDEERSAEIKKAFDSAAAKLGYGPGYGQGGIAGGRGGGAARSSVPLSNARVPGLGSGSGRLARPRTLADKIRKIGMSESDSDSDAEPSPGRASASAGRGIGGAARGIGYTANPALRAGNIGATSSSGISPLDGGGDDSDDSF